MDLELVKLMQEQKNVLRNCCELVDRETKKFELIIDQLRKSVDKCFRIEILSFGSACINCWINSKKQQRYANYYFHGNFNTNQDFSKIFRKKRLLVAEDDCFLFRFQKIERFYYLENGKWKFVEFK